MDETRELWNKAAAFHGHVCGGLTIGYKAALYAIELLGLTFSPDEELVCVAENDACGCDAIQAILGCSVGKGNLLFHMTGKQAFSFYERKTGKSLVMTREESFAYYQSLAPADMFHVKEAKIPLPQRAQIFGSYVCDGCGEVTGANWIRLSGDKKLCVDCYRAYDRFHL